MRFEKAYEHVTEGKAHPPEEMISIPNHPQLIAELSQPLIERRETGKVQIESKDRMRRRGVKSPNFADSLVLSLAADAEAWTFVPAPREESLLAGLPRDLGEPPARPRAHDDPAFADDRPDWREADGGGALWPRDL